MRTTLFLLAAATPGAGIAYLLLVGYLVNRIRPVPLIDPLHLAECRSQRIKQPVALDRLPVVVQPQADRVVART
jgi:hypothetical protein